MRLGIVDGKLVEYSKDTDQSRNYIIKYNNEILWDENGIIIYADGDENVIIKNKKLPIAKLEIKHVSEATVEIQEYTKELISNQQKIYLNSINDRLPDPRELSERLQPFTEAVVLAIKLDGKDLPLTHKQRQRKSSLYRNLKNNIEANKEISIANGTELLELNGLNVRSIFNPKYVVHKL